MTMRAPTALNGAAEHALLRVLLGDPRCELDDLDWSVVLPLAGRHKVTLRLADRFTRRGEDLPAPLRDAAGRERERQAATLAFVDRLARMCASRNVMYVIPDLAQEYPDVGRGVALLVSGPPPDVDSEMFFHAPASLGRGSVTRRLTRTTTLDVPDVAATLRVHHGRLGRLGEQPRLARLALGRRRLATFGDVACFIPSVEDELLVHTLRFMYGRPALRLGDVAWLLAVIDGGTLDWDYVARSARDTGLLHGLSCLLDYADQIHRAVVTRPLYDARVRSLLASPGGWGTVEWRDGAWRYPSTHVTRRLLVRHMVDELLAGSLGTMSRLLLVPAMGARQRRRREAHARRAAS
jgi:hypothetical protein